jgi:2-oxoglutarate ferredoxin oxidoreductase subunit beta
MAEVTHSFNTCALDKKFPHVLCPGCGTAIVLGSLIRSVHPWHPQGRRGPGAGHLLLGPRGRVVDFNTVHAVHAGADRATGINNGQARHDVIVAGRGDALSIVGNHFITPPRATSG